MHAVMLPTTTGWTRLQETPSWTTSASPGQSGRAIRHHAGVSTVEAPLDDPRLAPARGRMTLPLAAGAPDVLEPGTSIQTWEQLVDPEAGWLDQVAADWAERGGFDDHRRPWVLTVFGLAHQLTHATVAHLLLTDRVLDLGDLRVRMRDTGPGRVRASGLVLDDPAPAWSGTRADLVHRWWTQLEATMQPLVLRAGQHGVRPQVAWGEPVGLATVACHTLAEAGVKGARRLAEELADVTGRRELTSTEDDPDADPPGWRARRTTCCQWWQSSRDAHYCRECPLHRSPRAAAEPLPVDH